MHYYLNVSVDLDPDEATITGERQYLVWNGLAYLRELRNFVNHYGGILTWFVRADDQIAELCGSFEYLFHEHQNFWHFVKKSGDEIGLHPHLYEYFEDEKRWKPELDPKKYCDQLKRIHHKLFESGLFFNSIRIGEGFNSNELMRCIDSLGYKVDSTAIAGRFRKSNEAILDWGSTTCVPYNPSFNDYRVSGGKSLRLVEVPMTTTEFLADYDSEPKLRYMSLSYRSDIFSQGFEKYILLKGGGDSDASAIVFIIHPGEIFDDGRATLTRGLYSYDVNVVGDNLKYALQAIKSNGHSFSFVNTGEFADAKYKNLK